MGLLLFHGKKVQQFFPIQNAFDHVTVLYNALCLEIVLKEKKEKKEKEEKETKTCGVLLDSACGCFKNKQD